MKKIFLLILITWAFNSKAQHYGSINVGGDFDKFYPTEWIDNGWFVNMTSHIEIGRANVHLDSDWRGTVMGKFDFRTYQWGNAGHFIKAEIIQHHNVQSVIDLDFIAGWKDATGANGKGTVIIWLRGGGTTYFYSSRYLPSPRVFDGVANPLPYQEFNGPTHTYKTLKDAYVNSNGFSNEGTAYFAGNATNYFAGNLGLGTPDTKGYKLAVAGNMIAESIKVKLQGAWPDYVFAKEYPLATLQETEKHTKEKGHLPGIPSAEEVKSNGVDLGDMNVKLLQKIEELTLHLIELKKQSEMQNEKLSKEIDFLKLNLKEVNQSADFLLPLEKVNRTGTQ